MIPEPDDLHEMGQIVLAELQSLPLAELDQLLRRAAAARETARHYEQLLQAALNQRFSQRAQQLRQQAGKTTGTVRFEDEGYTVIADLPKRPEYDQQQLKAAVESLRKWGENTDDYVGIEIKVPEARYSAWPPAVRQLFEPARTVKVGKPLYRLERVQPGRTVEAANDCQIGEDA